MGLKMNKDKIQEAYESMLKERNYMPDEGPEWTVVRVWRNVIAKTAADAIMETKRTGHDEVQSVKSGKKITVKS
jgi:hypothetical protein